MSEPDTHRVTRLLAALPSGADDVANELAELIYDDLLRIAEQRIQGKRNLTLEPGALVSECWIRLAGQRASFESRSHFFAIASRIMMRVLLDAERRRAADKREGRHQRVTLSFDLAATDGETDLDIRLLAEALESLERTSPRKAQVARLRGLAGLSIAETAARTELSAATVERDWSFALAWLSREVDRLRS